MMKFFETLFLCEFTSPYLHFRFLKFLSIAELKMKSGYAYFALYASVLIVEDSEMRAQRRGGGRQF